MASITREITVDVAKLNRFAAIVAKQYDRQSRFLKVHIVNEDKPVVVESGATVVINARRPDDTAKAFAGAVNEDGTVTVPLTFWMLELDGTVRCDISIINTTAESELTTTLFDLEVQEAACGDADITKDEDYGILLQLIDTVSHTNNEAAESAKQAAASAGVAATSANTAGTKAGEAVTSATNAAASAGTATTKATEAATCAKNADTSAKAADTSKKDAQSAAATATTKAGEAEESAAEAAEAVRPFAQLASQLENLLEPPMATDNNGTLLVGDAGYALTTN